MTTTGSEIGSGAARSGAGATAAKGGARRASAARPKRRAEQPRERTASEDSDLALYRADAGEGDGTDCAPVKVEQAQPRGRKNSTDSRRSRG